MILKKLSKSNNGGYEGGFLLSDEQVGFLLNYAIADLLQKGSITVEDVQEEGDLEFLLKNLNKEDLPKC